MFCKGIKYGVVGLSGAAILGGLIFGRELVSYVSSGARQVRTAVKESVPVEFELERARDMVDGIIPELHANIRLIAQEEVEIAELEKEINQHRREIDQYEQQMAGLRRHLDTRNVSFRLDDHEFSRDEITERLAHRLQQFKQARSILESKEKMLTTRQKSLQAARTMLERSRAKKAELEQQIEALAAQHRLVKAQAAGSKMHIEVDDTQLARADKLLSDIQKRLDVAQRVLAHESNLLVPEMPEPVVSEAELLAEVDAALGRDDDERESSINLASRRDD